MFEKFLQTKLFSVILVVSLSQKQEKKKVSLESAPQILSIKISKPQNLLSTSWTSRLVKVRFKIFCNIDLKNNFRIFDVYLPADH